jgi:hypothetical protein
MCDFSLELYQSRPAQAGETYETHRFPSGTIGFTAPGDRATAICMAYDMRLKLEGLPESLQNMFGIAADEEVTFIRLEAGPRHDGIRFANGVEIALHRVGPGVKGYLTEMVAEPIWEREASAVR